MDILSSIQKQYYSFSSKEKRIADYILSETGNIKNMNIIVFAENAGVSDGTVSRFCRKIGCGGFTDLKIKLSAITSVNAVAAMDPLMAVHEYYKDLVDRTNHMMKREMLEDLIRRIQEARYIYIYGLGSSGLTATELMLRLMRMGFQGQSITDSHIMLINSSIVSEKDVVIAISISGETSEVVHSAAMARKNNCHVACITSFPDSPLAQNADSCLLVPNSTLVYQYKFMNSQFSTIYVVDLLTSILLEDETKKDKLQITVDTIMKQSHVDYKNES